MSACTNHPTASESLAHCVRCGRPFCASCVVMLSGLPYCAACKTEHVRDLQSGVAPGALPLASVWQRIAALVIDGIVMQIGMCVVIFPVAIGIGGLSAVGGGKIAELAPLLVQLVSLPFTLVVPLLYEGLMLRARGQTLGKMVLGIKVVTPEGNDISSSQAWTRAGVRAALRMCCALVDLVPGMVSEEKTCLHDMAARTRVVRLGL